LSVDAHLPGHQNAVAGTGGNPAATTFSANAPGHFQDRWQPARLSGRGCHLIPATTIRRSPAPPR